MEPGLPHLLRPQNRPVHPIPRPPDQPHSLPPACCVDAALEMGALVGAEHPLTEEQILQWEIAR